MSARCPRHLLGAALIALSGAACSTNIDLTHGPLLSAGSDPSRLGVIDEQVNSLVVDDERVYWYGLSGGDRQEAGLRSCAKTQCAGSLLTYTSGDPYYFSRAPGFIVNGGRIFWVQIYAAPGIFVLPVDRPFDVPQPVFIGDLSANSFVVAGDTLAVCGFSKLQRVSLSRHQAAPPLDTPNTCSSLFAADDYLYWTEGTAGPLTLSDVKRQRVDGTGAVETVVSGLELPIINQFTYNQGPHGSKIIAVANGNLYWPQGALSGSIARCSVDHCADSIQVLAEPVRTPLAVVVSGSQLAWLHGTSDRGYAISRCQLEHCEPSEVVGGVDARNAVAFDEGSALYTATSDQPLDLVNDWVPPPATIRVF